MNNPILNNSIRLIRNLIEDAPVNAVGGGHVAGLGVGDQGEPPGVPASKKKRKDTFIRKVYANYGYLKSRIV